ncbi:hypothetical protein [Tissierella sp.]|uniref:hypothetical protein n=1 Tax=Tissierella sp. TaxID=41274 RepID=UPI0028646F6E|nr:hypothetical protein [Tissierella sp.]MDR7857271.1 hypothetical protein [Tissierella sp.]
MIIGIGFVAIGIFIYIRENYDIDIVDGEKVFNKKDKSKKDLKYKYNMLVCIFSLLLGIYRIINSIIY